MNSKKGSISSQPRERKIFLNSMNSWFSNFVIEEFRTDYLVNAKTKNNFMGTLNTSGNPLPSYFEPKITKIEGGYNYNQEAFINDIFIYNLDDSNGAEVEFMIKGLRIGKHETEKTGILISNILTWGKTPNKTKTQEEMNTAMGGDEEYIQPPVEPDDFEEVKLEEGSEKKEGEENMVDDGVNKENEIESKNVASAEEKTENREMLNETGGSPQQDGALKEEGLGIGAAVQSQMQMKKIFYYKDNDYMKRAPSKKYFPYKILETGALTHTNPMLKTYVICPGFIYGCGEDFFFDYFRMAWLGNPPIIPIIGDGSNSIPTIHILDGIQVLRRVIEKKPLTRYIIACDKTKNTNLKSIIKAISKCVGNGKVKSGPEYNIDEIEIPNYTELTIDVKVKPSKIGLDDKKKQDEDLEDYNKRRFPWHCEYGIIENTETLRNEFNGYRGLKSVKIIVLGPPSSGKSKLAERIAGGGRIPCLKVKDIIEQAGKNDDDIGKEIQGKGGEIEEIVKKAQDEYDHRKNKKRTDPPFDPAPFRKFPTEGMTKIIKAKLTSNECLSQGYVMDGYPKNYEEAVDLYMDDQELSPLNVPDSILYISNCTEENLKTKVKSYSDYSEKAVECESRFTRRYTEYKANNETEGTPNLKDFFVENNLAIFEFDDASSMSNYEDEYTKALNYGDRNGPINNYERLADDVELIKEDSEIENEENGEKRDDEDDQQLNNSSNNISNISNKDDAKGRDEGKATGINDEINREKSNKNVADNEQGQITKSGTPEQRAEIAEEKIIHDKLAKMKVREKKLLEKKSEVLRRYLSNNVIPLLSKGIGYVSQTMPEDPVEALANYLLDNSFTKQMNNVDN